MGRPVAADAEATRARILAAATDMFSAAAARDVSIRQIGAAAGVTLATVHHHFGTKDQLYQACVEAMYGELEALRGELEPLVAKATEPSERLSEVVRTCFVFARRHRGAIRFLLRTVVDTGAMDRGRLDRVHLPFLEQSSALLAAIFEVPQLEARFLAQSLMHLVVRYAITEDSELIKVAGQAPSDKGALKRAEAEVAAHLAVLTARMLGVPEPASKKQELSGGAPGKRSAQRTK
jgi:AcrR family transcriptional regulator